MMLFSTAGYVLLPSSVVWANPVGEEVVGGAATFDRQGNTLTVNQATDRLAVNWQDFSIAAGETTHFNMPNSASIALNRVLGGNPSQIYGTLSSNGNIILVNNAGIFVGPGGVVNAASFVGSTLDIDPQQFMNAGQGGFHLSGDSYAPIVNQGNITAEKGDVFLIAQKVENRGAISAPNGTAALVGSGERTEVVLHEVGGAGFAVRVTQLEGEHALGSNHNLPDGEELLNEGEIAAAQAELMASGNIYALAIKNTGTIRAKAVVAQADGTVRLDGGAGDVLNAGSLIAKNAGDISTAAGGKIEVTGQNVTASPESIITAAGGEQGGNGGRVKIDSQDTTVVQGKVDASAPAAKAKGGKVELLGERVGLFDGAKVDASGGAGGGRVLAGGDYLGGRTPAESLKDLVQLEEGPVKNAKATVMAETAEIRADATVNGDGGKIILWSDEYTGFYGQLFARGGAQGGDGGFVETSSLENLQAWGEVWVESPKGRAGSWLVDPVNVTITTATSTNGVNSALPAPGGFTWVPTALGSNVQASAINTALVAGATVTITTAGSASGAGGSFTEPGNITVGAEIIGSGNLKLTADNDIDINAPITLTGGDLTLSLTGKLDVDSSVQVRNLIMLDSKPAAAIAISSQVQTTGNMKFLLGGDFKLNSESGLLSSGGLDIVSTAGAVTLLSNLSAIGGVSITSGGNFQANGTLGGSSLYVRANGGGVSFNNSVITTGSGDNGAVQVQSGTGTISLNSNITSGTGSYISVRAENGNIQVGSGATLRSADDVGSISLNGRTGVNVEGVIRSVGGQVSLESTAGGISRNGAPDSNRLVVGAGGLRLNGNNQVRADVDTGGRVGFDIRAYSDAGFVSVDFIGGPVSLNAAAAGDLSITASHDLTVVRHDDRNFAGANVSLNTDANDADIILGGNRIVGTTSFSASPNGVGQIQFSVPQVGDEVSAPTQNYNNPTVINTGIEISGNTEINFNDPVTMVGGGLTVISDGVVRFNNDLSLTAGGLVIDGNAETQIHNVEGPFGIAIVDEDDVTGLTRLFGTIGANTPIAGFVKEQGTIRFEDAGSLVTPFIDLAAGGQLVLLNVNLLLATDVFLETNGDITLGGTIESNNDTRARGFRLVSNASPLGTSGQVIINGAVGAGNALGLFEIDTSAGNGDILVNAPVTTRPGELNPSGLTAANNGKITLKSGGNLVLSGNLTSDDFNAVAGDIELTAGAGPAVTGNIQLGAVTLTTRGGDIVLNSDAFLMAAATLNTAQDNLLGGISFLGRLDGAAPLTLQAGTGPVQFSGSVGGPGAGRQPFNLTIGSAGGVDFQDTVVLGAGVNQIVSLSGAVRFRDTVDADGGGSLSMNLGSQSLTFDGAIGGSKPFGLAVSQSGAVTFNNTVRMGGNFSFGGLSGPLDFAPGATLDGPFAFSVTPVSSLATVGLRAVGSLSPIFSLFTERSTAVTTLRGDITTSGGEIRLLSPLVLGSTVSLKTTGLGVSGNNIVFGNTLTGSGVEDLTLNAGNGAVFFGGTVSQIRDLSVPSAGFFNFTSEADLTVTGSIAITPQVTTNTDLKVTAGNNITLTGGIVARDDPGLGKKVTLDATGSVTVGSLIEISGRSGTFAIPSPDGSSFTTVGTPGFNGGELTISGASITIGSVNALGSNNFVTGGKGGNGGTITLTSAGPKTIGAINVSGGNGGPAGIAGSILFNGGGDNVLTGNITGNGGIGEAGSPGGSAAVFDFAGDNLVLGGATVQITALGGADAVGGGRGQDGNFTFGALRSADGAQNNLLLNTGRGSISFVGDVGNATTGKLGQITVVNALNVTFQAGTELHTSRFVQNASVPAQSPYSLNSAGLTTFRDVYLYGSGTALDLNGYNFTFLGAVTSTDGGGSVRVANNGILRIGTGGTFTLGGDLLQSAGETPTSSTRAEIGADLTTSSGLISFASPTRLTADVVMVTGANGGAITFSGLLDSDGTARNLTLSSGGTVTMGGVVGSLNPLASLTTDAGGALVLGAAGTEAVPSLNVAGAISLGDRVSLTAATVVQAESLTLAATGKIDGDQSLQILLGSGDLVMNGRLGGTTPLTSLRVQGATGSKVRLGAAGTEVEPSVTTTGNQYYQRAVVLAADTALSGGSFDFLSALDASAAGAQSLFLNSTGILNLSGKVGAATALRQFQTAGAGNLNLAATGATLASPTIKTTEAQLFGGSLVLVEDGVLVSTTTGDFIFENAIDSRLGIQPRTFTVSGQGKVVLEAAAGASTRLSSVSLTGVRDVTVLAGINTFGGTITIESTSGTVVLGGNTQTGAASQLGGAVNLTGATEVIFNGGEVATFGGGVQTTGPAFVRSATTITTDAGELTDGAVTFTSSVNGAAPLTVNAGTAAVVFTGKLGESNPMGLTVGSSSSIDFQDTVMMGGAFSLTANSAGLSPGVRFRGTLDGRQNLAITGANTPVAFEGELGGQTPLAGVTVNVGTGVISLGGNLYTSGGGVGFGSPVEMAADILIDTTSLVSLAGAPVSFAQGVVGAGGIRRDLVLDAGTIGTILFGATASMGASEVATLTIRNAASLSTATKVQANSKYGPAHSYAGKSIVVVPTLSSTILGSSISLEATDAGVAGASGDIFLANGIDTSSTTTAGGDVTLRTDSTAGRVQILGNIIMDGGTVNNGEIGLDGGDLTVISKTSFVMPRDIRSFGGTATNDSLVGKEGTITVDLRGGASADLSFGFPLFRVYGSSDYVLLAGRNIVLGEFIEGDSARVAGTTLEMNRAGDSTTSGSLRASRGNILLGFGGSSSDGFFYLPGASAIVANGGRVEIARLNSGAAPVFNPANGQRQSGGVNVFGPIYTTLDTSGLATGLASGSVLVNPSSLSLSELPSGTPGYVRLGTVLSFGGPVVGTIQNGLPGGLVSVRGTDVLLAGKIDTHGSDSQAQADLVGLGGNGGSIQVSGDRITVRRDLVTYGGAGLSDVAGFGGGGGSITLTGPVVLDSGSTAITSLIWNTQGGLSSADGEFGSGGNITTTGTLTGTATASNTLDLRYGSGDATLGDAAADTITLGTLITAADDARSSGSLVVNGKLVVNSLVTYARPYSLSIFGAGTQFSTLYTFLNTGTVGLGAAGAGVTFVGGFNSTAGAATRLNGIVNTGSAQSLDNGGNMAMGAVILAADSSLNSNGNNITLTTIDNDPGVSGAKDLTFASGVGSTGVVTISGAVGSLNPVDVVTVNSAGPVTFASSFNGGAIVTAAGTTTTFRGGTSVTGPLNGITTTGASSLGGTVSLVNSLYASDTTQVFTVTSSAGTFDMPGTVTMSGGPFALAGPGAFTVAGTLSGSQTLTLSGAGGKTFSGSLTAGNGTTAITATGGAVTFGGIATLSGASTFAMAPTLTGGTITASGLTTMNAGLSLDGAGTLGGAGSYQINGNITEAVPGQRLTLSGAGQKTITGTTTVGGITQNSGSGQASFGSSVTTSSTSDFFGAVVLRGTTFTAGGATSYNTLSLQAGDVILAGNFAYTVSGAVTGNADGTRRNLTLNGNQAKTFNGALSGIETLAIGGGSLISSGGLEANTLTQNGNAVTLGGSVNVANALNLDGATSLNSGTTLTAASGMNISAGSFASNGNARLAGGTVTIGIGTLTSNAGTLTVAPGVQMGTAVTLAGPGNYAFLGNLGSTGADRNLTLGGALTSFAGTLTGVNNLTGNGAVSFGNNVTTSGSVAMNGVTTTSANVTISSGANNQTFARAVTLGGNLASQTTSTASFGGGVSGVGNLTVNGAGSVDIGAGIENRGTFLLTRAGAINLGLGDLTASEVGLIRSSEGATFEATGGSSAAASGITANTGMTLRSTAGSASASSVVANTGLTLDGATGATIAGTTVNGDLNMTTLSVANFNASLSSARSLGIQAASISSGGQAGVLANISVPVLGGITLTGGGLDYQPAGNLTTTGRIATSGDVVLAPSGNFVNSFRGNPFTAPSVKILTQDFFSYPASAGVPGLANVFGVSSVAQLGANQIGVAKGLLAGSAGPYITEFTTGTGQPYILATQNNAVPPVMLPMALPSAGTAFASRVTFTQDELEMMTPEERSAFEAGRRQQAARVMLQREGGLSEEIGTPAEGQIPQAKAPEPAQPAPTAQVLLDGKPLASTSEKDRGDASRLLRTRPMRAVVLRGDSESQRLMESERIAAEVTLGSIPVAGNR